MTFKQNYVPSRMVSVSPAERTITFGGDCGTSPGAYRGKSFNKTEAVPLQLVINTAGIYRSSSRTRHAIDIIKLLTGFSYVVVKARGRACALT